MAAACEITDLIPSFKIPRGDLSSVTKKSLEDFFGEEISSSEQFKLLNDDHTLTKTDLSQSEKESDNTFVFYLPNCTYLYILNSICACSDKFRDKIKIPENSRLSILLLKFKGDTSEIENKKTILKKSFIDIILSSFKFFSSKYPCDKKAWLASYDDLYYFKNLIIEHFNIFNYLSEVTHLQLSELASFLVEIKSPDKDYKTIYNLSDEDYAILTCKNAERFSLILQNPYFQKFTAKKNAKEGIVEKDILSQIELSLNPAAAKVSPTFFVPASSQTAAAVVPTPALSSAP